MAAIKINATEPCRFRYPRTPKSLRSSFFRICARGSWRESGESCTSRLNAAHQGWTAQHCTAGSPSGARKRPVEQRGGASYNHQMPNVPATHGFLGSQWYDITFQTCLTLWWWGNTKCTTFFNRCQRRLGWTVLQVVLTSQVFVCGRCDCPKCEPSYDKDSIVMDQKQVPCRQMFYSIIAELPFNQHSWTVKEKYIGRRRIPTCISSNKLSAAHVLSFARSFKCH